MPNASESQDPTGRGRGALLLLFLALIVVVINVSNWFVLSRVTASVDEELGLRLVTVAASAVTTATPELLLDPAVAGDEYVRRVLRDIATRHELEDVFLVDTDGVVLFDLGGETVGERSDLVDLEFASFTRAVAGIPAASPSLEIGGDVLKAGYAPVEDWDGTVEAVIGVTAGGGFHARVPALRRTLLGITLGSGALVILLGALFFGMSRRLARTETALVRAETLSAMGMMAAGVAHEVRNPLAIIAGTAERLRRKYGTGIAEEDPLFGFIPEEVDRLNGIVKGYLRFARNEPLAFVECDLAKAVERSAGLVADEFAGRGVTVMREGCEEPVPGRADPQRLQQVLLNLLLNGAQAMPEGGTLRLALETKAEEVRIRVSDEGTGLDDKQLRGAFTPFFTTKETGSGLGLAMAKRIVEGHGGTIELANRPEGGAIVTVVMPRRARLPEGAEES
jgi:signal transduction histidine kinase